MSVRLRPGVFIASVALLLISAALGAQRIPGVGRFIVPRTQATPGFPMTCDATATATSADIASKWTAAVSGTEGDPYILCVEAGTYTGGHFNIGAGKSWVTIVGGGGNPTVSGMPKRCDLDSTGCPTETFLNGGMMKTTGNTVVGLRITGFKIKMDSNLFWEIGVSNWRFDHNWVIGDTSRACWSVLSSTTRSFGLVDHVFSSNCQWEATSSGTDAHANDMWVDSSPLGSTNTVVYEDDIFHKTDPTSGSFWNCFDANEGGAYNLRFSELNGCRTEGHGIRGAGQRGTRAVEQAYVKYTGGDIARPWLLRSGGIIVFGNRLDSLGPNSLNRGINIDVQRDYTITNPTPTFGVCDGSSSTDGNESGFEGFPCLDQPGMITDASDWGSSFSLPRNIAQTFFGVYSFLNYDVDNSNAIIDYIYNCPGSDCTGADQTRMSTKHLLANKAVYKENASFDGTSGIGVGTLAARPATCTADAAMYWATDQGSWNTSSSNPVGVQANGADGLLYRCTATNTWTLWYTPLTYPHPKNN
jgi:hypothetical protein